MSTQNAEGSSKKKPILVVLLILAVLVGLYFFFSSKGTRELTPEDFKKEDGETYVFYYPADYVKGEVVEGDTSRYENGNTKAVEAERIYFGSQVLEQKLQTPTYENCLAAAEQSRQTADDEIKVEVANAGINGGKGEGCKTIMKMPIPGVNDSVVRISKSLWNRTEEDLSVYTVVAIYFANASKDEAEKLNLAVDQFTLK